MSTTLARAACFKVQQSQSLKPLNCEDNF